MYCMLLWLYCLNKLFHPLPAFVKDCMSYVRSTFWLMLFSTLLNCNPMNHLFKYDPSLQTKQDKL